MRSMLLLSVFIFTPVLAFSQTNVASPPPANSQPSGDASHGKDLFVSYGCAECHSSGAEGGTGPHLAPNPLPAAGIAFYIRHPTGVMPAYSAKVVSDSDIADIHAYLQSIPAPPKLNTIPELGQ